MWENIARPAEASTRYILPPLTAECFFLIKYLTVRGFCGQLFKSVCMLTDTCCNLARQLDCKQKNVPGIFQIHLENLQSELLVRI